MVADRAAASARRVRARGRRRRLVAAVGQAGPAGIVSANHGVVHRAFTNPSGLVGAIGGVVMAIENGAANRLVVNRMNLRPGDRVLEIGCGPGVAARTAAQRVAPTGHVVAIDRSETMVRLAHTLTRQAAHPVDWKDGAAERLPVTDASVDVVFAVNSWHHWTGHATALGEIQRVLAKDGRVVI